METRFQGLHKFTVERCVLKTAKAYPCVDKVFMYPDATADPGKKYVLIYIIPDYQEIQQKELIGDTIPEPQTFEEKKALVELMQVVSHENEITPSDKDFFSYEASFDRKLALDECFGNTSCITIIIAKSMEDEEVKKRIHTGSGFWILYEKTKVDESSEIMEEYKRKEILSHIGRRGGSKSKKNLILIAALRYIFSIKPELKGRPVSSIKRYIKNNYPSSNPLKIAMGELSFVDDKIETYFKKNRKNVALNTFNRYVAEIKKEYKNKTTK